MPNCSKASKMPSSSTVPVWYCASARSSGTAFSFFSSTIFISSKGTSNFKIPACTLALSLEVLIFKIFAN